MRLTLKISLALIHLQLGHGLVNEEASALTQWSGFFPFSSGWGFLVGFSVTLKDLDAIFDEADTAEVDW